MERCECDCVRRLSADAQLEPLRPAELTDAAGTDRVIQPSNESLPGDSLFAVRLWVMSHYTVRLVGSGQKKSSPADYISCSESKRP